MAQVAHAQDTGTCPSIIGVDDIGVTAQIQSENLQKVPLIGAPTTANIIVLTLSELADKLINLVTLLVDVVLDLLTTIL